MTERALNPFVKLVLELGPIDDMDITWFNGVEVGALRVLGRWRTPRRYLVPAALVLAQFEFVVESMRHDRGLVKPDAHTAAG